MDNVSIQSKSQTGADEVSLKKGEFQLQMPNYHDIDEIESKRLNTCFHYLRYVVIILGGMMCGCMIICRLSINVAMLSMVNKTAIYLSEHPNSTADEFFPPDYKEIGIFEWNHEIQQLIMTGYMVAYALPQYATTRLSIKYGLQLAIPFCVILCAISCALTPFFSYWGWQWTLALRLVNGVGASALFPTMFNLVEIWLPCQDRPFGLAVIQVTNSIINCFIPWVSGLLTAIHWKWAFYVPTMICCTMSFIWYIIVADNPDKSRLISQKEYDLIRGTDNSNKSSVTKAEKEKDKQEPNIPWYFVFKVKSFYFLSAAFILLDSTACSFLFILPTYINRVLKLSVDDIGLMYSVVQIGAIFCLLCPNPVGEFLQKQFKLSLTGARNVMTFVCCFMVISTFTYLAFFHDDLVIVLIINRFFHVALDFIVLITVLTQFSGQGLSGLVFSVMNALANIGILIACWTIGKILDHTGDSMESWFWILNTFGAMMAVYFVIYVLFLKSQPINVDLPPPKALNKEQAKN